MLYPIPSFPMEMGDYVFRSNKIQPSDMYRPGREGRHDKERGREKQGDKKHRRKETRTGGRSRKAFPHTSPRLHRRLLPFRLFALPPVWAPDTLALRSESVDFSRTSKSSLVEPVLPEGVCWMRSLSESTSMAGMLLSSPVVTPSSSVSSWACFLVPRKRPTEARKSQAGRRTRAVSLNVGGLSSEGCSTC